MSSLVSASERRGEEQRKKRRERRAQSPPSIPAVTEHDRLLAERWGRMEQQSHQNAIQGNQLEYSNC